MAKLRSILQGRFQKKEKPKMSELASKTSLGELTPFSGLFGIPKTGQKEETELLEILSKYAWQNSEDFLSQDLFSLLALTAEVRAINNQAVLLHGERIKKAQEILKKYREGAFTAWLKCTYGNRQTPYNFLQYYEFYQKIPQTLHSQMEAMPRQAIYTLATREGEFSKKEEIVRNYQGESKHQMLTLIRSFFPLNDHDKRKEDLFENITKSLERLHMQLKQSSLSFLPKDKKHLIYLLEQIQKEIDKKV